MLTKWIFTIVTCLFLFGCTSHGSVKEFDGLELFYQEDISITEVDKLGKYLQEVHFTNGEKKSVQLLKTDTSFTLKMVIAPELLLNDSVLYNIEEFKEELKYSLYPNVYFELHLCDKYFETTKVLKQND